MKHILLAVAGIMLLPTITFAEQWPQEVRDEFVRTCVEEGADEALCVCMLEGLEAEVSITDLENGNVNNDQITRIAEKCIELSLGGTGNEGGGTETGNEGGTETGNEGGVGEVGTVGELGGSFDWGPECRAYFQAIQDWCNDPNIDNVYKQACPAWVESIEAWENALPENVSSEIINAYEESCKMAKDALDQSRAAMGL